MRHLIIAFVLLFAAPAWADTRDPVDHFFQPRFGDFQAELEAARQQGKKELRAPFDGVVNAVPGGPGTVAAADCQPKPLVILNAGRP